MKREKTLEARNFEQQALRYMKRVGQRVGIPEIKDFSEFKVWYRNIASKEFSVIDIDTEVPAPHLDGSYIQKLSYQVGFVRDSSVVRMIAKQMAEHKKVMVIYGGSHLHVQLKVLEKMFGKATYSRN